MHSDLKAINCNINQHKIFQVKHFGLPNATDGEVSFTSIIWVHLRRCDKKGGPLSKQLSEQN